MTDDEIVADLTRVRGIGRWTAEMFLMFNLHRPDVLPVDDLGVRNAVGRLYKMSPAPTAKELREFGERWRPYRSVASWYLWRSYDLITPETSVVATDTEIKGRAPTKNVARPRKKATAEIGLRKNESTHGEEGIDCHP